MERRKKADRIRLSLMVLFIILILAGLVCIAEAMGGLKYGMPLLKGVKQILFGGILLGFGTGGRYALG